MLIGFMVKWLLTFLFIRDYKEKKEGKAEWGAMDLWYDLWDLKYPACPFFNLHC